MRLASSACDSRADVLASTSILEKWHARSSMIATAVLFIEHIQFLEVSGIMHPEGLPLICPQGAARIGIASY